MIPQQRRRTLLRLGALGALRTWAGLAWLGSRQVLAAPRSHHLSRGAARNRRPLSRRRHRHATAHGHPPARPAATGWAGSAATGHDRPSAYARPGHRQHCPARPRLQRADPAGIVRSDLRRNLDGSNEAGGVPLTLRITLVSHRSACTPLAGHALYVWHCTREGDYSVYASGDLRDNRLRGVQVTDAQGQVRFSTIVPGCYMGRMPHIHFEVYAGLAQAVDGRRALTTSQLAFPTDTMTQVYAQAGGYEASARNLAQISFATDMVFADGVALQMVDLRGSLAQGFEAAIQVAIDA